MELSEPAPEPEPMMLTSAVLSLRTRVASSIFWLAWSRGVLQIVSFSTTLLVARILVPADYGVMAIASMWTATAALLTEMGLGAAIIQFQDLDRQEIDTCFWITMTLSIVSWAILSLGAWPIANWFAVPRVAEVLPVLALLLPLGACSVVSDSLLRKRLALDRISQAEMLGAAVALPVTLICALAGWGVWALVSGSVVGPAVRSLATFAFAPWRPGLRIGGRRAREMLHFSLATLGIKMLAGYRSVADVFVIGKLTDQATLGLYSMAKDLALLPGSKLSAVVNMLSTPMMAELQTNIGVMRAAFYRAVRLIAALTFPASAGMALVADDMVMMLLGSKWAPAVPILRLLCVYAAVRSVDVLLPPVLFARQRQRFLFWYCVAQLIAVSAAAVAGALWAGPAGVVVCSTPVYCALMAVMVKEALEELEGSFTELWSEIAPIFAATAAMAGVVLLLRELFFASWSGSPWFSLLLLSSSGAATYVAALFTIGSPVIGEGAEVIGWALRRRGPSPAK